MSVNKVILVGNVGKDPEVRHLDSGITVANFTLATGEKYTAKNGEKVEKTEWHQIVIWGKQAEIAEKYVTKGTQLYIEGKLQTRTWESKQGEKHYTTEIVLSDFNSALRILSSKNESKPSGNQEYRNDKPSAKEPIELGPDPETGGLPF